MAGASLGSSLCAAATAHGVEQHLMSGSQLQTGLLCQLAQGPAVEVEEP